MKCAIDLFLELGTRLEQFGREPMSCSVIVRACEANGWFTPTDVQRAVDAICTEMLQPDRLKAWLANYPVPVAMSQRVLVIMAGNIPLVGFFDLLCVVAAGDHCVVKPSSKDFVLMQYMVTLLREIDPSVQVSFYDEKEVVDAVIATGSDNANRYFKRYYTGVPSLLRGSRQSVAVLAGDESPEQLRGIADDVFAYSGLGCRNVSLLFVPRGYDLLLEVPVMNPKYHNNYLQTKALIEMSGREFHDMGGAVAIEQQGFPTSLSCVNYTFYDSLEEVSQWLTRHDNELQCVVTECLTHSRRCEFGCTQSPSLSCYPDERDVIAFLLTI